jgi:uncharacterized protein (TIGR02466 family)
MLKKTDIFAHTIHEIEFPEFENIQQPLIDHISSNFNSEFNNEYYGHDQPIRSGAVIKLYDSHTWYHEGRTIENPNLKSLLDWITEQGKLYWKTLGLSSNLTPYVLQAWATAVKRGGFVASHNHNPVPISGVFYLKCNPNQGNLFLENPLDLLIGKSALQASDKTPTRLNYEVQAISGKLVLFPGWMKHFTRPNDTDELRMSMAVNIGCHGQVHFTEFI